MVQKKIQFHKIKRKVNDEVFGNSNEIIQNTETHHTKSDVTDNFKTDAGILKDTSKLNPIYNES